MSFYYVTRIKIIYKKNPKTLSLLHSSRFVVGLFIPVIIFYKLNK